MPPSVSLIVPIRPDGAERDRNWAYLRARYQRLYPDWEIVEHSGNPVGAWSKGSAVNAAARQASGDVLIVADADVIVGATVLPAAVDALKEAPWVIPHGLVYRLSELATVAVLTATAPPEPGPVTKRQLSRKPHTGPAGGGLVVTRREDLHTVGGIDERFTDWGGEDISFARALDTLIGQHTRLGEPMWHLYHRPMPRLPGSRASPENEHLAARYLDANGDPLLMGALCDERPYPGMTGGGIMVAPREAVVSIPLDERFAGWGQPGL